MNPKEAKELLELPQIKNFVSFIASEADKLRFLDDLDGTSVESVAVEVKARAKAYKIIQGILTPFLTPQTVPTIGANNKDFEM